MDWIIQSKTKRTISTTEDSHGTTMSTSAVRDGVTVARSTDGRDPCKTVGFEGPRSVRILGDVKKSEKFIRITKPSFGGNYSNKSSYYLPPAMCQIKKKIIKKGANPSHIDHRGKDKQWRRPCVPPE